MRRNELEEQSCNDAVYYEQIQPAIDRSGSEVHYDRPDDVYEDLTTDTTETVQIGLYESIIIDSGIETTPNKVYGIAIASNSWHKN